MVTKEKNGKVIHDAVEKAIDKFGVKRDELIPILSNLNQTLGYLPKEALEQVSSRMQVPKSQLFSAATFYSLLSVEPRGRHVIQFCENAPCHVSGGKELWEALVENLQLEPGETSQDGKWTLITTSCIGACSVAPVLVIDEDIYGNVSPSQINEILDRYE